MITLLQYRSMLVVKLPLGVTLQKASRKGKSVGTFDGAVADNKYTMSFR